jgi:hypothetical protein
MSVPSSTNNSRIYKHKNNVKEPTYVWIYKKINRAGRKRRRRESITRPELERDEMSVALSRTRRTLRRKCEFKNVHVHAHVDGGGVPCG